MVGAEFALSLPRAHPGPKIFSLLETVMKILAPILALSVLSACNTAHQNASNDKQIATNLGSEGATEATYLYWVKDGKVF